jgi:hypothetical protein
LDSQLAPLLDGIHLGCAAQTSLIIRKMRQSQKEYKLRETIYMLTSAAIRFFPM